MVNTATLPLPSATRFSPKEVWSERRDPGFAWRQGRGLLCFKTSPAHQRHSGAKGIGSSRSSRYDGRAPPAGLGSKRLLGRRAASLWAYGPNQVRPTTGRRRRRSLRSSVILMVLRGKNHRDECGTRHRHIGVAPATFAALSSLHTLAVLPARQQRECHNAVLSYEASPSTRQW